MYEVGLGCSLLFLSSDPPLFIVSELFLDLEHDQLLLLTMLCPQRSSFLPGKLQQLSSLCIALVVQPLRSLLVAQHVSGGSLVGGTVAAMIHIEVQVTKNIFSKQIGEGTVL